MIYINSETLGFYFGDCTANPGKHHHQLPTVSATEPGAINPINARGNGAEVTDPATSSTLSHITHSHNHTSIDNERAYRYLGHSPPPPANERVGAYMAICIQCGQTGCKSCVAAPYHQRNIYERAFRDLTLCTVSSLHA